MTTTKTTVKPADAEAVFLAAVRRTLAARVVLDDLAKQTAAAEKQLSMAQGVEKNARLALGVSDG